MTAALSSYFAIDLTMEFSRVFVMNMMALQTPNSSDPDDLGAWDASYEILVSLYKARTIKSKVDTWELPMISNASFQSAFQEALASNNISLLITNFTPVTVQPLTAAEAQVYQGQNSSPWRQLFGMEACYECSSPTAFPKPHSTSFRNSDFPSYRAAYGIRHNERQSG